jgi:GNAT superfamily N-acetyltransferase
VDTLTPPSGLPADPALDVRPYATSDRDALLDLLRDVWPHKSNIDAHVDARWWWQYPTPPVCVVDDRARGCLAGLCAYIPFTLRTAGADRSSAWFVDFFVRQTYQGRGLGQRLTHAVQQQHDVTASLSQTAMAYRVFHKLGWSDRSPVTLYMHPYPHRWLFGAVSASCRVETVALEASLPAWSALNAFWLNIRDAFPAIVARDSASLIARYAARRRRYELVCAYRGAEVVGYMIVRAVDATSAGSKPPAGLIVDYLVRPDDADAFGALLADAARILTARGISRLYAVSTLPACERILRTRGFLSPSTPLLGRWLAGNTKWLTYVTAPGVSPQPPSDWHLTIGDCDLDDAWM